MAELQVIEGSGQGELNFGEIQVVRAKYIDTFPTTWQELFSGYDELYALTYSLGMRQVEDVMCNFKYGEVIIGSPSQIRSLPAQIFADQQYDIGYFCRNRKLQERVKDGSFRLYVTTGSHEKLYLLKAYDGRKRVIMGSANFSVRAWNGAQQEGYICFDDEELYDREYGMFESLLHDSSDEIGVDAKEIREDGQNVEDLPLVKRIIQAREAVVIHDVPDKEEVEYIIQTTEAAKKWAKHLAEAKIAADKENVLTIDPKKIIKMKQSIKDEHREKTSKIVVNPEFLIDYRNQSASFADKEVDLQPDSAEIKKDIDIINQYMQGTNDFTGDPSELRKVYWKIIIYMFSAPFIAPLRYSYREIAPANSVGRPFPMYMLLRGPKNGGKSSIIRTVQCLMFGQPLKKLSPKVISPSTFDAYLLEVKGCPILIDDITNNRFKYLKDIVKNEDTLLSIKSINHGCFILTSNEADKVDADVAKRVVVFNIWNQLADDVATKMDRSLHKLQKEMGTALYRRFLKLMIPKVDNLVEVLQNDSVADPEWKPDIFSLSSQTLMDIYKEQEAEVPQELKFYKWEDFMGEAIKADKAVNIIRQVYAIAPHVFEVRIDKDLLLLNLSKANLSPKDIECLKNELPVATAHTCVGSTLPIQLSAMAQYAGIDFEKDASWLSKLQRWFRGN
ncbi:restriction endonuclease PLD domain-containing protein [Selenomonas sp. KH1T6]|uniref:restriction endonuclease PLD domain-containing protein n=1 Tax=Selenomonas sp. KH1T6 TaxID=3158784 RepID=UPI0008A7F2AB|nr:NgoFVII restriction endonuclease [Selenomonas ruminantium]